MVKRPQVPGKIDADFFRDRLLNIGRSQRGLAKELGVDPSAITLMLKGERRLQMEEIETVARYLQTSVEEVLRAAGLRVDGAGEAPTITSALGTAPLAGSIDDSGNVLLEISAAPPKFLPAPADIPRGTICVRLNATTGPMRFMAGALFYYRPATIIEPDAIGRLSIVSREPNGPFILRGVERGLDRGTYRLHGYDSNLEDGEITSATPVIWIRP